LKELIATLVSQLPLSNQRQFATVLWHATRCFRGQPGLFWYFSESNQEMLWDLLLMQFEQKLLFIQLKVMLQQLGSAFELLRQ